MSSVAFSVPRARLDRSVRRHAAARAAGSASAAAEEALATFRPGEFRRTARRPQDSEQSEINGLAATIDQVVALASLFPWRRAILAVVVVTLVAACAVPAFVVLTRPKPPCDVYPVQGSMFVGKTVPVGARIVLTPKEGGWPYDSFPTATVRSDGTFRLSTFGKEDGAPAGTYVATVQWFPVTKDGSAVGNVLDRMYASPATSPLTVSVSPEPTSLPPLRVSR